MGGLAGYGLGARWGRKLVDVRVPWLRQRQNVVSRAEAAYAKWGRLAVFVTPTVVSGLLRMKFSQFAAWNFAVGAVYVLSVGPAAYGAGKVVANEQDWESLVALVAGLAIAAGCAMLAARYYRRRRARRFAGRARVGRAGSDDDDAPGALTRQG